MGQQGTCEPSPPSVPEKPHAVNAGSRLAMGEVDHNARFVYDSESMQNAPDFIPSFFSMMGSHSTCRNVLVHTKAANSLHEIVAVSASAPAKALEILPSFYDRLEPTRALVIPSPQEPVLKARSFISSQVVSRVSLG
jgi:hypothetical protein